MFVKRDPFMSLRQISGEINNEVSSRTIRKRSQGANLPGRIVRRVPLLRPHHLRSRLEIFRNRLDFAKSHISGKDLKAKRNGEIFYGLSWVCFQMITHAMYEVQWVKNSTLDSQKRLSSMGVATSWCIEGFLGMALLRYISNLLCWLFFQIDLRPVIDSVRFLKTLPYLFRQKSDSKT